MPFQNQSTCMSIKVYLYDSGPRCIAKCSVTCELFVTQETKKNPVNENISLLEPEILM